ncbi:type VI secretion system tip protein VgrG [Pseudomonas fakonensis]|uniref:Type VI secretion system tip protein VgrG n=1 Tax=Pseudomonas fakonensis TaxID=2842355 RepID=A0ABX8N1S5_9PSED|nr:type VI secretion system tip protein TssI/VgrG [Pseudomonas fakonensis]QXH49934.1 type VI secretion system tip protein VgrG [Pseudomonas fakonensis]
MLHPGLKANFTLAFDEIDVDFQVLSFEGFEAISQPYRFEVELVSERPDIDLESLLHKQAFLAYNPDGNGIHAQVYQVAQGDSGKRLHRYRLVLVPHLAYLAHRTNQRIFQQLTAPQIIGKIFEEHGLQSDAYRFSLGTPCPVREYCVQYDESDLHFVQRLCEEEGMHYHFEHSREGHLLVFGDDQAFFPKLGQPASYVQDTGMVADEPVIKRFNVRLETRPSRVTRRDYDFEKPRLLMEAAYKLGQPTLDEPDLEDYDYPAGFTDRARGKQLSQRALERHRADYQQAEGHGDVPRLVSGHFMQLAEHPRVEWNDLWLLTEVYHEGKQPQVLEESVTSDPSDDKDDFHQGYRNRFLATPWDVFYRPPFKHPKPQVLGSQSAVVTGPKGEEIYCDEYGRVKVQFFWDREGKGIETTSCWLRVSSSWAGERYGGVAIPRIGMEVLVTFLEGDPDQPLVSGCLYHAVNPVPYALPAHKTRTTFKTLSSPGGGGFNELRIEDKKGQEQIFVHAQRDWDQNIGNDQKIHVGNERHDTVVANSYSKFQSEEHRTTLGDRKTEIKVDDHLTVGNNQHVKIGTAQLVEAGREVHIKAGDKVVIDAGMQISLSGGGSFITLDAGGVKVVGAQVLLNAGGAPGSGSGIGILSPLLPGAAATALAGKVPEAPQVPTWLELNLHYKNLDPVPGAPYRVEFADGSVKEGKLDDKGFARLEDVPSGKAMVYYGEDPRPFTRDSVVSVVETDEAMNAELRKLGLDPDDVDLQALIEQHSGRMV